MLHYMKINLAYLTPRASLNIKLPGHYPTPDAQSYRHY